MRYLRQPQHETLRIVSRMRSLRNDLGVLVMTKPRYLTRVELANLCRVTVRTVERWIVAGTCPPITRFGRRVLFNVEAVEAWERKRTAA